jgi:predicted dehydrogenase
MTGDRGPLRIALIGSGTRASYLYGPLLKALPDAVTLVALWGRSPGRAEQLAKELSVPWYTDFDRLIRETAPEAGIVCANKLANGQVGRLAVEHGLHVLLETPIALDLAEADAIIAAAARQRLKVEVAEQFHRRPIEQIKLALISSGLFGRVHSAFNDFVGHAYHGVSVMRSYLGFDAQPTQVTGAVGRYELTPHAARLAGTTGARVETQEHGIVEFASGQLGLFHWTDVGYDSPLRWWRSSRFLAERGMGITVGVGLETEEWLTLLAPGGEAPRFITLERRWERVDGGALEAVVAHTGDPAQPIIRWENPFRPLLKGRGVQWHDDEIGVASCLMSLVTAIRQDVEPSYGPLQARLDQEIVLAIRQSAAEGGRPVRLPLDPAI